MKNNSDKTFFYLLAGITLVGFFLRLHGIGTESITADEASALFRLKFSSFSEMINGGVRPDGHPAFTQVLLWFWTKWFGNSEFTIRLPFVIFGTASIWLSGNIGKKWFSNTTGLATAVGIAFLQFPIMYSQLARPYAPGLFFTLLAVYFWTQFVKEKSIRKRDILGFAFAAALAAYSHYFSLLTTTLFAVAGIFYVGKEIRLRYLIACLFAVLLFLPHISITLHQMEIGGIGGPSGWLSKPTPDFFMDHLRFVFDGSAGIMWGTFLVSGFLFLVYYRRVDKFQLLSILIWFLPMLIGYVYSVNKNPVLQDSVLLFSFPFLLMFLFSWLPDFSSNKIGIIFPIGFSLQFLLFILIIEPYHLTDHFGRLKELVTTANEMQEKYYPSNVDVFYNVDGPFMLEYNCEQIGKTPMNILGTSNNGFNELLEFKSVIENSKAIYFVYGWSTKYSPLEILPIIREQFPYLVQKKEWFNSAVYVFSKLNVSPILNDNKEVVFHSRDNFETNGKYKMTIVDSAGKSSPEVNWSTPCKVQLKDSSLMQVDSTHSPYSYSWSPGTSLSVRLDSTCIYSPSLKMKVDDIAKNPDNEILFSTNIKLLDSLTNIVLVIEFQRDGKQLYWNGMESNSQIDKLNWNQFQTVYFGLRFPKDILPTDIVNIYCYSLNGNSALIDYLDVKILKGHTNIYGPRPDFK